MRCAGTSIQGGNRTRACADCGDEKRGYGSCPHGTPLRGIATPTWCRFGQVAPVRHCTLGVGASAGAPSSPSSLNRNSIRSPFRFRPGPNGDFSLTRGGRADCSGSNHEWKTSPEHATFDSPGHPCCYRLRRERGPARQRCTEVSPIGRCCRLPVPNGTAGEAVPAAARS